MVFALSNRKRHRPFDALMVDYGLGLVPLVLTVIQKLEVNAGLSALCGVLHKAEQRSLGSSDAKVRIGFANGHRAVVARSLNELGIPVLFIGTRAMARYFGPPCHRRKKIPDELEFCAMCALSSGAEALNYTM